MDEKLRGDALEAQRILGALRVTVLDAALEYVRRMELVTKARPSPMQSTFFWTPSAPTIFVRVTSKICRVRLTRFALNFGDRKLADIAPTEIDQWLRTLSLSPLGRNTFRARISTLFEFGRQCGWTDTNPVAEVRKVKVSESLPGILTRSR